MNLSKKGEKKSIHRFPAPFKDKLQQRNSERELTINEESEPTAKMKVTQMILLANGPKVSHGRINWHYFLLAATNSAAHHQSLGLSLSQRGSRMNIFHIPKLQGRGTALLRVH